MADTYYEGRWDCSDCGQTGILGRHKECPRCGEPQNSVLTPSEDWYLPDGSPEVTDPDLLEKFKSGEAWNCGHCETLNYGDSDVCSRCGRPLDFDDTVNRTVTYDDRASRYDEKPDVESERIESGIDRAERAIETEASDPREMEDVTLPGDALPRTGKDTEFYDEIRHKAETRFEEKMRLGKMPPWVQRLYPHRKLIGIGIIVLAVLVVIGLVFGIVRTVKYYTDTVEGAVTVSELHWERKVEVEEYKTLTQHDWSYPGDARVQGSERRIRTYRTVHDGWRTEQYTDYETRYRTVSYTDMETRYRTVTYSGTCSRTVSNGNGSFRSETYSCPQTRTESYTVPVQKTKQESYTVPVQKTRQVEITHQEPVWDDWYTYQIDRWVTDRWVAASDASSAKVDWPEVTDLHQDAAPGVQIGEERVGDERNESYVVVYADSNDKSHTDNKGYDLWKELEKGETIPASYRQRTGELVSVNWDAVLQAA